MAYNLYINGTRTDKRNNKTISSVVINNVSYSVEPLLTCTVSGLGSQNPSNVLFTNNTITNWTPEVVTKDNMSFVKFPTFYRKVNSVSSNQITSFTINQNKIDNDYLPYPCFVKEDGVTVMDYILVGVNLFTNSEVNMAQCRTAARNYGDGYQVLDWMIWRLLQDLAICKLGTVNTNNGNGLQSLFGIDFSASQTFSNEFVDGIIAYGYNNSRCTFYLCNKPTKYANSTTSDYNIVVSTPGPAEGVIKSLYYSSDKPFVNFVSSLNGSDYNTYYCDKITLVGSTGDRPIMINVGYNDARNGVYYAYMNNTFQNQTSKARLCYRPIE